jgi:hypothetical protein
MALRSANELMSLKFQPLMPPRSGLGPEPGMCDQYSIRGGESQPPPIANVTVAGKLAVGYLFCCRAIRQFEADCAAANARGGPSLAGTVPPEFD